MEIPYTISRVEDAKKELKTNIIEAFENYELQTGVDLLQNLDYIKLGNGFDQKGLRLYFKPAIMYL